MERLEMALLYGADAVYLALNRFGMRAAAGNFSPDELRTAVRMSHERGVRVYVACNNVMHEGDIAALPEAIELIADAGADALILSDMGALRLAKKHAPSLDIHISTQAGVANSAAATELYELGAKRVILARELTLDEIAKLRQNTPADLEIEVFAHGSMCVSFSGRCLLSNYLNGRDGNRGACSQPCRWKYRLIEERRPDEPFEITEDGGTYILNSRDLCMIDHIGDLIDAGVTSLKIEGRAKSAYYAAVITNAYRHAADCYFAGVPLPEVWRREVYKVSHRDYSTGFFFDEAGPGQSYDSSMYTADCDVVAVVAIPPDF